MTIPWWPWSPDNDPDHYGNWSDDDVDKYQASKDAAMTQNALFMGGEWNEDLAEESYKEVFGHNPPKWWDWEDPFAPGTAYGEPGDPSIPEDTEISEPTEESYPIDPTDPDQSDTWTPEMESEYYDLMKAYNYSHRLPQGDEAGCIFAYTQVMGHPPPDDWNYWDPFADYGETTDDPSEDPTEDESEVTDPAVSTGPRHYQGYLSALRKNPPLGWNDPGDQWTYSRRYHN